MFNFINSIPQTSLDSWYRWLTFLAIGLPVLGAILGAVCGWGAFRASNRIAYLQAADLRQAQETIAHQNIAIESVKELAKPRRISSEEAAKMQAVAQRLCSNLRRVPVTAANSNQEAQAYALDFVTILKNAGCVSDLELPIPGLTPDVQGVRVGVRSLAAIPIQVAMLEEILRAGGIQYQVNPLTPDFFPNEPFVLIIGAKPTRASQIK